MSIDSMLGREFIFNDITSTYTISRQVTVVGFDPDKGWRLWSAIHGSTWVPRSMWRRLLKTGVLEQR